jgi:hypothetical protein
MLYDRYKLNRSKKMKRKKSNQILLIGFLLMVLVFAIVTIKTASATYNKKVAEEKITEPDFYAMSEYCADNSQAVMKALKAESAEKLKSLMIDSKGIEDVLGFASWSDADLANVISLGAGSFSTAPDKDGKIDISERFVIPVGDQKYVLYVETLTSRHGMNNEGVSVIAATTYDHFDQLDYGWNGAADDSSAVAGKSFVKN